MFDEIFQTASIRFKSPRRELMEQWRAEPNDKFIVIEEFNKVPSFVSRI